jgi:hypothetical protein
MIFSLPCKSYPLLSFSSCILLQCFKKFRYSDSAKIVARVLTSLGFNNCWTVSGGFSGGRGWLQSWLGADSYNVSFTEVLRPSRIIPAAAGRVGTASSKLLPGGD